MSLLNDALRKKRKEQDQRVVLPAAPKPWEDGSQSVRNRARLKKIALFSLIALVAAGGGWYWWQPMTAVSAPEVDTRGEVAATPEPEEPPGSPLKTSTPIMAENVSPMGAQPDSQAQSVAKNKHFEDLPKPSQKQAALVEKSPLKPSGPPKSQSPAKQAIVEAKPDAQAPPTVKPSGSADDVSVHAPPSQKDVVERLYQKAKFYHRQQQLEKAINMYREVLKLDPDHYDGLFNLTSAYIGSKAYDKANLIASDLHIKQPDDTAAALNLAIAKIGIGRPAQALQLLDEIEGQRGAPRYEIFFHRGVACKQLGRLSEAIDWYRKAENLKPADTALLFNLAVALDQQLAYDQAVQYYRKYLVAVQNSRIGADAAVTQIKQRIRDLEFELSLRKQTSESVK